MKKTLMTLLAALLALSLLCPALAEGGRTDITICNTAKVPDMNPVNWYISSQSTIFDNVYSTLIDVVVNDDLSVEVRGDLASSWETEEEGKVFVFHLNENAVYSNGDPVTADDVKNCFERHMTNPYTMSYVSMIESIDVRDEHTVAFNLTTPWASAPYCWYMVAIFHPALYDADPAGYALAPVASGPYELADVDEATDSFTLTLKQDWWGEVKPTIQTINARTIADISTMIISLQKGEIDFATVSGTNIALVMADNRLHMKENVSLVGTQLMFSANAETLQNKAVREAIAYAIDYNAVANVISGGFLSAKNSSIRFSTLDADIPESIAAQAFTYDPDRARQILADAGIATPYEVGPIYGGENGAAEMVQQYLSAVGLVTNIEALETNTRVQNFMTGNFTLGITSYPGYVSAAEPLLCCYGTGQTYNFMQYSNARMDELAAEMMSTQDADLYAADLEEALQLLVDDIPNISLGIGATYSVGSKDLSFMPTWSGLDMFTTHW